MRRRMQIPLMAKMLLWLSFHLLMLALAFMLFVNWQLKLGLDSLVSGAAGDRLETLGEVIAADLLSSNESDWDEVVEGHTSKYGVDAWLLMERGRWAVGEPVDLPEAIHERLKSNSRRPGLPAGSAGALGG